MTRSRILGVIPARAGSKGLKKKNLALLCGKPLLYHTIAVARRSKLLTDFIVSTDSEEIAAVAKQYNAKVPFLRPKTLARDETPTLPVLQHALREYERLTGSVFDYVMLLQPTAPLRQPEDIDRAIRLLMARCGKESLISVYEGRGVHPRIMYRERNGKVVAYVAKNKEMNRRQSFEPVYVRNGAVYLTARNLLLKKNRVIGQDPVIMEMPRWQSINIDSPEDLEMVEMILKNGSNY